MPIGQALPLLKFDETKHARGEHGRFTAGEAAPKTTKPLTGRLAALVERIRGVRDSSDPSPPPAAPEPATAKRPATDYTATPPSTGNVVALVPRRPHAMKLRDDTAFVQQDLVDQRPAKMPAAEHEARKARLKKLIVSLAPATIERGYETIKRGALKGTTLIPTGTATETVSRAYTHAAMLALHGFGVARYDFSMPAALQQELTPLVPFMRYAQRRVLNTMLDTEKGQWKPYRAAFGEPFRDKRRDKVTGEVRLRMQPRQQVIKAVPMGALAKAFDEGKHKRAHDGEFAGAGGEASHPDQNVQLAAGATGGAAAAFTASRAAKQTVNRAGAIVGRRTTAGIRLGARKLGLMQHPEAAAVVRGQSRMVGNFVGHQTRQRLGFGVALGSGLLGNYGGELIARRASGATGKDDAYQGATLGGLAVGALGIALGHKAGIGRFSRFTKPARLMGRLGKAYEEDKHHRSKTGEFASQGASAEPERLAQPAQLLGGAVGAAAAGHAASRLAAKPAALAAAGASKAASSSFLRAASDARATSSPHSAKLVHLQAKGVGHAAHFGVRGAVAAAIGVGAGLGGDLLGDWAGRKLSGAKGHEDEYRHASLIGMATGTLGAVLGHKHGSSKLWRGLRYSPRLRAARGIGGAVAGSVAAEVAGNVVDEKAGATDMLASVNRRTAGRFQQAGKAAPMGALAKGYDGTKHPREHDGKFAGKTAETVGRTAGGAGGALVGFALGDRHGHLAGRAVGGAAGRVAGHVPGIFQGRSSHSRQLLSELHEMKGRSLGGMVGARYGRVAGGALLGLGGYLAGSAAGAALDERGRRSRADEAGQRDRYDRLNAKVSVAPNKRKQVKRAGQAAMGYAKKVQRAHDFVGTLGKAARLQAHRE